MMRLLGICALASALAQPAGGQVVRPEVRALTAPQAVAEPLRPRLRSGVRATPLRPIARPVAPVEVVATSTAPDLPMREGLLAVLPQLAGFRPATRPTGVAPVPQGPPAAADRPVARTGTRPDLAFGAQTKPLMRAEANLFAFSPTAPAVSLRPTDRPARIVQAAVQRREAIRRGQVCRDPAIQGEALGRVPGRGACGIDSGVRVRSIAGVTLRPAATIDCPTARALKTWVENGARPAVGGIGGGIDSLRVVSHYSCRFRNSAASGRLSEHSFGRAIDIAGIGLKNGDEITLLTDWGRGSRGTALRRMWSAACGPFGTVLGPESNRFHRDHFHFDTARYRSGSYCR